MSGTIHRGSRARADLIEIWSYIADDNEPAATRMLRKIESVLTMLAEHPEAGRARPELAPNLRSFPVGNYVVFYEPRPDGIEVLRALSSYLDVDQADIR